MAFCDHATYDLVVIGSGPAGQGAALAAAGLGKRVAVAERPRRLGGLATHGAIPAQAARSAIIRLSGRGFRGANAITVDDLFWRTRQVVEQERATVGARLRHAGVHVLEGDAAFRDARTLELRNRGETFRVDADRFVVAVGTTPERPEHVDGRTVLDWTGILGVRELPKTLTVVGGGLAGLEIASLALTIGIEVTLVRHSFLDGIDEEVAGEAQYHLRGAGLRFADRSDPASDAVLYAGTRGATDGLALETAGVACDASGLIRVGDELRTANPRVFAAGDVTGATPRAASAFEQGRAAALAAFGRPASARAVPLAVYTLPEVAGLGPDEEALKASGIPHVVGRARYRDLARAEIDGGRAGLVKLLVHAQTREILGVHIFGTLATELVHTAPPGLAVDDLAEAACNFPSYSYAFRIAADDARARLAGAVAAA